MSSQSIVILVGIAYIAGGLILRVVARPFCKLAIWWQEKWLQFSVLKPFSVFFERNENNMTSMVRMLGIAFIVFGAGCIFAALTWMLISASIRSL